MLRHLLSADKTRLLSQLPCIYSLGYSQRLMKVVEGDLPFLGTLFISDNFGKLV